MQCIMQDIGMKDGRRLWSQTMYFIGGRGDSIDTIEKIYIGVTEPDNPGKHAY